MKEINLTKGPILKKLIQFSLPMISGNILQQLYNLVDTLIVGRYIGPDALAAVGSAYTLMIFITSIIIGLCMGSGAFFSEDYGAGNKELFKKDIILSFFFILTVSVLLYLIIFVGMDPIIKVLKTPQELFYITKEYISIVFAGLIFIFLYNFFAYLLRSMGNSMVPLVFLAIPTGLNIGLDIFFITVMNMGVKGAALATLISQAVSGIGISIYALSKLSLFRDYKIVVFDKTRLKEIIVNDISTGIQQSVMNFGILMIQGLVNSFGPVVMAAFAVAVKIDTVAYMPAQEFGNAYSLFISQNYGAKEKERIKQATKISFMVSAAFCVIVSILIIVFSESLMGIFVGSSEIDIIMKGAHYLKIEGSMYIGIGILFLWYGYFRGINKPQISLLLTVISLGTRVLLSYTLAPTTSLSYTAIWYSIPIGWFLADITGIFLYRKHNTD